MLLNRPTLLARLSLLMCSGLLTTICLAFDSSIPFHLTWKGVKVHPLPNGEVFEELELADGHLDDNFHPVLVKTVPLPSGITSATCQIKDIQTEGLRDTRGIQRIQNLNQEFKADCRIVYRKRMPYAEVVLSPIRRSATGTLERITDCVVEIIPVRGTAPAIARTGTRNSVLSQGAWYRIAVTNNGVYRLGYDFLRNLGIPVNSIDPRNLRVYGNGGGQLPYLNSSTPFDDLQENAIFVSGESDGRFDAADYALFYGTSQTRWKYDATSSRYQHANNQYCDTTYFFITADLGPGKRITQRASTSASTTVPVNEFSDFAFHENDEYNLLKSGREWYGDRMDNINTTRSFTFSFPNLSSSDTLNLRASLLGRATNSINHNNSSFTIKVNGQTLTQGFSDVGTSPQDNYASPVTINSNFSGLSGSVTVTVLFSSSDPNAQGWINFLELNTRCALTASGRPAQYFYRDPRSVGTGNTASFNVPGTSVNHLIWDVTDPRNVIQQASTFSNGTVSYNADATAIREYVCFTTGSAGEPLSAGSVSNQNLHGLSQAQMVIIAHSSFLTQANRLAEFHRSRGLTVQVIEPRSIYNEFSSGAQDVCAIRNMMKMFYDRATSPTDMPRYLLLFGDASYDNKYRIENNTAFIPSYQSAGSLNNTQTYMSDDFFGLLDDTEGEWTSGEIVDLAVGRLPVKSAAEADAVVNKILNYGSFDISSFNSPLGDWRNTISFVADDQDNNTHFKQSDTLAERVRRSYPVYNIDKVYLDAYNQLSTPGGQRYPDGQKAIVDRVERGALLLTYVGHGGEVGWAHERVLELSDIYGWTNFSRLPAFLTATCEFSRLDDPERTSAGEDVFLNPNGGGICLFTTSRLAFSSSNFNLCQYFFAHVFNPFEGRRPTIGEVFEQTKIDTYSDQYVRNFLLIGDPALPLAYPGYLARTTRINGQAVQSNADTLKALSKVTIEGEVTDKSGNLLTNFNGFITPTVFDKWTTYYTLGNDASVSSDPSFAQPFNAQRNIIYKGKVSVVNGQFSFTFVVPKDIQFRYGNGKISYYAQDGNSDATGYDTSFVVGGFDPNGLQDDAGPELRLYMNDEKFVRGSMTNENPLLLAYIADSSGINAVGSGIGHDMTVTLDRDANKTIVVNDYFENNLNSYQQGKVSYPFQNLTPGPHTLTFKVWDVYNNSSEATTDFIVESSAELALDHVLNYPNPFTTSTTFMFDHNRPYSNLDVQVQIFTVSGKLIKTLSAPIFNEGFHSQELQWDGLDDFGDRIGKGVYLYRLKVRTPEGFTADKFEKLVILR